MSLLAEAEQTAAEQNAEITPRGKSVSSTKSDLATPATRQFGRQWQQALEKLSDWWTDPQVFDDEDYEPPSPSVVSKAIGWANKLKDDNCPAPHRVVTDASGGIIFERRNGLHSQKFHFWDDGKIEFIEMNGHKVINRRRLI